MQKVLNSCRWPAVAGWLFLAGAASADPAALSRTLIEQLSLEAEAQAIVEKLAEKLEDSPRVTSPGALFTRSTSDAYAFASPLQAFARRLQPTVVGSADGTIPLLELEWPQEAEFLPDCELEPLPRPTSLEDVAAQVLDLAERTQALHDSVLKPRQKKRLQRDVERVLTLLENPQPAMMTWFERRRLQRFLEAMQRADFVPLHCAALVWTLLLDEDWLASVRSLMAAHPAADADVMLRQETPLGDVVFAGRADSRLPGNNVLATFDLAGNDFHGLEAALDFSGRPQLIVDFSGNDHYGSSWPGGHAAGIGRIALLRDESGDDSYTGSSLVQGAALLGVGVLQDLAGNDSYQATRMAQGFALYGVGLLQDIDGDDRYLLQSLGQGAGLQRGIAALVDGGGDDDYRALGGRPSLYGNEGVFDAWAQGVGLGLRGLAEGGVGVLLDQAGADNYEAGNFAQGGGYYRGVGMLLDRGEGSDVLGGSRYAQGWGAHGGVGYLSNEAGDDTYWTRHSVNAGLAWDYSLALFRDEQGDDHYRVGDFSLAASAHHSIAWFIDGGGKDRYEGTQPARRDKGAPNFSLFHDAAPDGDRLDGDPVQPGCRFSDTHGFSVWAEPGAIPICEDLRP